MVSRLVIRNHKVHQVEEPPNSTTNKIPTQISLIKLESKICNLVTPKIPNHFNQI
jgi:hypothetical protein